MLNQNSTTQRPKLQPLGINICAIQPHAYPDTVGLLLYRKPGNQCFRLIKGGCQKYTFRPSRKGCFRWRLRLHVAGQPLLDFFEQWREEKRCTVSEVHHALDLHTDTVNEANELKAWFDARLIQPHRRAQLFGQVESTSYYSRRRWKVTQIVAYVRESKLNGRPCLHLEYRLAGSQPVRQAGINSLARLHDHSVDFWRRRLVLEEVDYARFARIATGGRVPPEYEIIAGNMLARYGSARFDDQLGRHAQVVRGFHTLPGWEKVRHGRINRRIDAEPFLPRPTRPNNSGTYSANTTKPTEKHA